MPSQDDHDEERDRAIDLRAEIILDVAASLPHRYEHHGVVLDGVAALQSEQAVSCLLKVGSFSMNLDKIIEDHEIMRDAQAARALPAHRVPAFMLAVGVHYAIKVAPLTGGRDGLVISLRELVSHVDRIEAAFGRIPIDRDLVSRISRTAHERVLSGGAQPVRDGEALVDG